MVKMYDDATKAKAFDAVARRLEALGVRPDDVLHCGHGKHREGLVSGSPRGAHRALGCLISPTAVPRCASDWSMSPFGRFLARG